MFGGFEFRRESSKSFSNPGMLPFIFTFIVSSSPAKGANTSVHVVGLSLITLFSLYVPDVV
jgi:hypothetical protein